MIVIVACGSKKLEESAPARALYTGPYFKACMAYALTLAPAQNVRILSAKYGLVGLSDVIAPYNYRLGRPFAVTEFALTTQAEQLGLLDQKVTVLGGKRYVGLCRKVWKKLETPLEGKGGIGKQIAWLRGQTHATS